MDGGVKDITSQGRDVRRHRRHQGPIDSAGTAFGSDFPGDILEPASGSASKVQDALSPPENAMFAVDLFELVDTSGCIALLFGSPSEMVWVSTLRHTAKLPHVVLQFKAEYGEIGCRVSRSESHASPVAAADNMVLMQ